MNIDRFGLVRFWRYPSDFTVDTMATHKYEIVYCINQRTTGSFVLAIFTNFYSCTNLAKEAILPLTSLYGLSLLLTFTPTRSYVLLMIIVEQLKHPNIFWFEFSLLLSITQ